MRWNWIYVLCLITGLPAMAANQGYRVLSRSQTLIQIARDVYKDERQWKEIAYWNGIKPPYALSVGQVLVLKTPPVVVVPSENLVTGAEVDAIKPLAEWPSVERKIVKAGDDLIYVVNERAPSLMMIARELYGDASMAKKISSWGGFEPDARLSLGQRLRLKVPPTKTAAEGTAILIKNWRALDNDLMVERLGGAAVHERQPAATPKKAKKVKQPCAVPCVAPCGSGPVASGATGKSANRSGKPVIGSGNLESGNGHATPGPAIGSASQVPSSSPAPAASTSAATANENREPQSSAGGDTSVLQKKSDSPDGIPAAHKTENYWLGDEAAHLIEVLQKKLGDR
jgi:hypothetical protein